MDRQVAPLGHIISIELQPVCALKYCMLNREAADTNIIVFGLTRPELKLIDMQL
jgi:hypothetical protein